MDLISILFWIALALFTTLPIIFADRKIIRWICIVSIFVFAVVLIHTGLRMAARNVTMPPLETAKKLVSYGDAWQKGRLATQEKVDSCLLPLIGIVVSLVSISLVPLRTLKK